MRDYNPEEIRKIFLWRNTKHEDPQGLRAARKQAEILGKIEGEEIRQRNHSGKKGANKIMNIKSERQKPLIRILAILTLFIAGMTLILPAEADAWSRPSRPKQVRNLTAKAVSTNSIKIRFKKVKNAKGYKIYQATKRYYYKVRAYKTYKNGKKAKYVYGKYNTKKSVITKKDPSNKQRKSKES